MLSKLTQMRSNEDEEATDFGPRSSDDERAIFQRLTGREREPARPVEELVAVVGRRGGKSRAVATLAAYLAGLCDHRNRLAPGEKGIVLCIAPDQRQASVIFGYAAACFERSPPLATLVASRSADVLSLTNGVSVEVRAASFRRLRGPTYVAVVADECAFWYTADGSANPDSEILAAVRPGLATTRGPLVLISSPYARRGELWTAYRRHFGAAGDPLVLVAQGASRDLNPTLPASVVERAMERDPVQARADFLAEFRTDIESFVSREAVEACVATGHNETPAAASLRYAAFVDPSGGSSDSFTLAVAHRNGDEIFLDVVREIRPPFSPESVVREFAGLLKMYASAR